MPVSLTTNILWQDAFFNIVQFEHSSLCDPQSAFISIPNGSYDVYKSPTAAIGFFNASVRSGPVDRALSLLCESTIEEFANRKKGQKLKEHRVKVQRTAHYYTLGDPKMTTRYFWLACHGYGQAASWFIRTFESVLSDDTFILAPEGLSRFYWGGNDGHVVSSWMTRKDQLDEIEDYSNYIQTLYLQYRQLMPDDVKVILFGFSQGVATQFRWIMREFPKFDHLVMWAGLVPKGLDYRHHQGYFADKKMTFIYGDEDEIFKPAMISSHTALIEEQLLDVKTRIFRGQHRLDRQVLSDLAMELS